MSRASTPSVHAASTSNRLVPSCWRSGAKLRPARPPASITPNVPSPQVTGATISLTAGAVGGLAPVRYQWWIQRDGAGWALLRDWDANPTLSWTASLAGGYDIVVHATFLGFAMSMVLAHAPVILPAVLRFNESHAPEKHGAKYAAFMASAKVPQPHTDGARRPSGSLLRGVPSTTGPSSQRSRQPAVLTRTPPLPASPSSFTRCFAKPRITALPQRPQLGRSAPSARSLVQKKI